MVYADNDSGGFWKRRKRELWEVKRVERKAFLGGGFFFLLFFKFFLHGVVYDRRGRKKEKKKRKTWRVRDVLLEHVGCMECHSRFWRYRTVTFSRRAY